MCLFVVAVGKEENDSTLRNKYEYSTFYTFYFLSIFFTVCVLWPSIGFLGIVGVECVFPNSYVLISTVFNSFSYLYIYIIIISIQHALYFISQMALCQLVHLDTPIHTHVHFFTHTYIMHIYTQVHQLL